MWFTESMISNPLWTALFPFEPTVNDVYDLMRRQMELNGLKLNIPVCFPTTDMLVAGVKIYEHDREDVIHCIHKKERYGSVCFQLDTDWDIDVIYMSRLLYEVRIIRRAVARMYGVWSPRCKSKLRFHGIVYDSISDAVRVLGVPESTFRKNISEYRNLIRPWPRESGDVFFDSRSL